MTKEEKAVVINNLAEQLNEYPHFYLTDIETCLLYTSRCV